MGQFAYQMAVGMFAQTATGGTAVPYLPDKYARYSWDLTDSIIPKSYDFTQINDGGAQIEAVENPTITQLTKARSYDSGAVTPPTLQLASILPFESGSIVAVLDALGGTVDDAFKVLFAAGLYKTTSGGVRTYDVTYLAAALLTVDGGRQGQAAQRFTGNTSLQLVHLPILGADQCKATLSWTEATNAIALSLNS